MFWKSQIGLIWLNLYKHKKEKLIFLFRILLLEHNEESNIFLSSFAQKNQKKIFYAFGLFWSSCIWSLVIFFVDLYKKEHEQPEYL